MVKKMTGPHAKSANALALEVGIAQPTLSSWLRQAASLPPVTKAPPPRPPKSWTPAEKLAAVVEASTLSTFLDEREPPPHARSRRLLRVAITRARSLVTLVRPHGTPDLFDVQAPDL